MSRPGTRGGTSNSSLAYLNADRKLAGIDLSGARRIYLSRGSHGFGFRLSTNHLKLNHGYQHYASIVDDGGQAQLAGLRIGDRLLEVDGNIVTHWCVPLPLPLP